MVLLYSRQRPPSRFHPMVIIDSCLVVYRRNRRATRQFPHDAAASLERPSDRGALGIASLRAGAPSLNRVVGFGIAAVALLASLAAAGWFNERYYGHSLNPRQVSRLETLP
jgi:hypothetical protein